MRALPLSLVLALAACTVTRKTDALACTTSNDCNNGRTCISGYCVTGVGSGVCPTECDSCTGTRCNILVTSGGQDITCPPGFSCGITCSGAGACGNIVCGPGACSITCQGPAACGTIDCATSCGCQVNCGSGDCGTNTCPTGRMGVACVNGLTCSTGPTGCNGC